VLVRSVFGWIMILQHFGHTFDWNLPWADYKDGFGSVEYQNFWLGLEKMHLLTGAQPYRLRVEMQMESTSKWYSAEYWSFKIGDELNDKYRLDVSGYSGDAGNALQLASNAHDGMKFTTNDQDNDMLIGANCVYSRNGGWWFNSCTKACMTCGSSKYVWETTQENRIVDGRMMIKPQ